MGILSVLKGGFALPRGLSGPDMRVDRIDPDTTPDGPYLLESPLPETDGAANASEPVVVAPAQSQKDTARKRPTEAEEWWLGHTWLKDLSGEPSKSAETTMDSPSSHGTVSNKGSSHSAGSPDGTVEKADVAASAIQVRSQEEQCEAKCSVEPTVIADFDPSQETLVVVWNDLSSALPPILAVSVDPTEAGVLRLLGDGEVLARIRTKAESAQAVPLDAIRLRALTSL